MKLGPISAVQLNWPGGTGNTGRGLGAAAYGRVGKLRYSLNLPALANRRLLVHYRPSTRPVQMRAILSS
jgi:hypothetical protein